MSSNITGEIVASSWWFIWIVWWCTDAHTLHCMKMHGRTYFTLYDDARTHILYIVWWCTDSHILIWIVWWCTDSHTLHCMMMHGRTYFTLYDDARTHILYIVWWCTDSHILISLISHPIFLCLKGKLSSSPALSTVQSKSKHLYQHLLWPLYVKLL